MSPLLRFSPGDTCPGAHQPYTAVLEARPSIRTGTQASGRGRTISRKRSRRWEPTAFPRRSHPASTSLALPSLTYKGADLREAFFDTANVLRDATLSTREQGSIKAADTRWGGVNL